MKTFKDHASFSNKHKGVLNTEHKKAIIKTRLIKSNYLQQIKLILTLKFKINRHDESHNKTSKKLNAQFH